MRSSGTKDCKEGRALLERESSTFRVVSLKAPVRKILIRILSSLEVSFSSTKVRRIVEAKVVVSQGGLHDRGGARVVREVRVGGVDQGGPVHENLVCRITVCRSFNHGYRVSETLPNVQNVWARVNPPEQRCSSSSDLRPASADSEEGQLRHHCHKSCQIEQPAMK